MRNKRNNKYQIIVLLWLSTVSLNVNAQVDDVTFTLDKIKNNYAGYKDKTKGNDFSKWVSELLAKNNSDTFLLLSKITNYFNDHHLQIYDPNALLHEGIDSIQCDKNLKRVKNYFLNNKIKKDGNEGYWLNDYNSCVVAVIKVKNASNIYQGFLIESSNKKILPGYLIATFRRKKGRFFETEYLAPGSGSKSNLLTEFRSDNIFTMSDMGKWKKVKKYLNPLLPNLIPFDYSIRGELLDKNTYLLTMPDFWSYNISVADSVIKADSLKIRSVQTLIIDIRNNGGGTVSCYNSLLPFIYTQPIIHVSGYQFIGKDFFKHREEVVNRLKKDTKIDTLELNDMEKELANFKEHVGEFKYEAGDTFVAAKIMDEPQNIAIIANYGCASAAEIMLLDFKQSKKVKIFGEHTLGAVDYLNIFQLELPSKKYVLFIPSGKRSIHKGQKKLDRIGIYPDVPIPDGNKNWIEFVRKYYGRQ